MKIFLVEYITAGGFNTRDLPQSLLSEAMKMRDTLFTDFHACGVDIVTTHDARLILPTLISNAIVIDENADVMAIWQACLQGCDAALVVAPESDGLLLNMTAMVENANVINLGSSYAAVQLCSDKFYTYQHLQAHGINTIPTYLLNDLPGINSLLNSDAYVIKPIDGAGCEDTWRCQSLTEVKLKVAETNLNAANFILQPYLAGQAASFTMLCQAGCAVLLSCNTQSIVFQDVEKPLSQLHYQGGVVNGLHGLRQHFVQLANVITQNISGLNGLVGVDVIVQYHAPDSLCAKDYIIQHADIVAQIVVVEINPRVTTSCVGLHKSIGINPINLLLNMPIKEQALNGLDCMLAQPVQIQLDVEHA